jgi:hypothetical protein
VGVEAALEEARNMTIEPAPLSETKRALLEVAKFDVSFLSFLAKGRAHVRR